MKKCSLLLLKKVIERQIPVESNKLLPEQKLWTSVIYQALVDLENKEYRISASSFFNGTTFDVICEHLGISPAATRELITKAGIVY